MLERSLREPMLAIFANRVARKLNVNFQDLITTIRSQAARMLKMSVQGLTVDSRGFKVRVSQKVCDSGSALEISQ